MLVCIGIYNILHVYNISLLCRFVMPTWTQPELEGVLPLCYNLTFTDYYEWFVNYGGNIRLILHKSDEYINKALEFQTSIIRSIFTQGRVSPDPHLIYILCHINPSKKRALSLIDPTSTTITTSTITTCITNSISATSTTTIDNSELSVMPVPTTTTATTTTDLNASTTDKSISISMKEVSSSSSSSSATIHRQSIEFDDGEVAFTFASDYIYERIEEKYRDDAICIAVRHFC